MQLLPEISNRKSVLVYSDREVEQEKIDLLIEAARWSPSCFNKQPWQYVFVRRGDETRQALEDALAVGNSWAKTAPCLVAVGADPEAACTANAIPYYAYDIGLSVMSLVVEAEHQGLRVHQMAGWKEQKVKQALGFPEHCRVVVLFALGYEGEASQVWHRLEQDVRDRLARPRTRKPPEESFFFGRFGRQTKG